MFDEFDEIDEIEETAEYYNNGSTKTTDDAWRHGRSDWDICEEIEALAGVSVPEEGAAIKKHKNPCEKQYQAAMQAAQELANSGYYTLEQAIQIVMTNL